MASKIPWLRVFVEGAVIVGSILLAFGIDAWWDEQQEREEEQRLLLDLIQEFEANRADLVVTTERHRERNDAFGVLLREAGPEATGLGSDSLRALASSALNLRLFTAERGVMDRALSGNGLSLISDPDLRTQLAGFWNRQANYFGNQQTAMGANNASVVFNTGRSSFPIHLCPLWGRPRCGPIP